ncbi:CBL-interacting serine/threonine-protein kinase 16 [Ancistrocladus abbreviatus]
MDERKVLFGKYEVGRLLGKGNFGRVYYGKHITTGEVVAIKMMSIDQIKKEGMMEQVKREISIMHLMKHPNIVQLVEVMATKTKIYLVMEYLKGGELCGLVEKGKLTEDSARKYFQQLICAVDYCHSRGVCHRDLKLENLLLDENGDLKLADFGISTLPGQTYHDGLLYTLAGAPAYVAPEILRRQRYDGYRADIWSCGVSLYALLAGYLPFQDENLMLMYGKILAGKYDFPTGFPLEARRLVSKILVVNPDNRITIAAIKRVPWFCKGFTPPKAFMADDQKTMDNEWISLPNQSPSSPPFFNAFEFICSMSSGFDLSNLFESKRKAGSLFSSKFSANDIVAKIEAAAKGLKCKVAKLKNFKVKLLGPYVGRKGRLAVTVEVFKVAPEVSVVEFSKSAGDTLEYIKFCEEDIRPALKDIIWTWEGAYLNNNSGSPGNAIINGSPNHY